MAIRLDAFIGNYFVNYFKNSIDHLCRKKKLNTVLEVGCYDGYILDCLKKEGYKTLTFIRFLNEKNKKEKIGIGFEITEKKNII